MNQVIKYDLQDARKRQALIDFLEPFDLILDQVEESYVVLIEDQIVATCSINGSVLKCFAVAPAYQNMGLTTLLMTNLFEVALQRNLPDLFVITKPIYSEVFLQLHFKEIYASAKISLLHYGESTLARHLLTLPHCAQWEQNAAIVMNANPFTLGHQHLVEFAASQICTSSQERGDAMHQNLAGKLFVFVVEEDRSTFRFAQRMAMVQAGCQHLKQVIVLPSSPFMISAATFPSYFLKEQKLIVLEHAKMDATVFAKHFASRLKIKRRFVGEEPADPTTAMYNEVLSKILPTYGISLTIIPRQCVEQHVISASTVRSLLEQERWEEIKPLVPRSTYDLLQRFRRETTRATRTTS